MNPTVVASAILFKSKSRRITGEGFFWQLDGNSPEVQRCKEDLLPSICLESSPYVHYDEECPSDGILAQCSFVSPGIWRVPRGATGEELLSWLYMGNWQLYVAEEALPTLPDLCRAGLTEVASFIRESGVVLVIDSFHDDSSWTVGFAQGANHSSELTSPRNAGLAAHFK
ncbi:MAG: hypothetical protein RIS44_780 [Pseudomonadota bacterium]|jgi:hypothetical protein